MCGECKTRYDTTIIRLGLDENLQTVGYIEEKYEDAGLKVPPDMFFDKFHGIFSPKKYT